MVNAVGGSTVHYPGLSARLAPWNFESRSRTLERYGAGAIPAGSTLADWPLSYEELEPAYEAVERAIGVAGGGPGRRSPGRAASPYPLPPLRRSGWTDLTDAAARSLGWHPFPAPAAINSQPYNGNPQCTYCGFCSGNVCHRDAKGSTDVTVIRRALATGRLRVRTGARVTRIDVDRDGLASGATFVADGREQSVRARCVMLATFTYENARLLLLSRSRAHPAGLANGSGQVGRHYMAHVTPFVFGLFPGRRLNLHTGLWAQATCVEDWNADNFDHDGLGFIGGGAARGAARAAPDRARVRAAARRRAALGRGLEGLAARARAVASATSARRWSASPTRTTCSTSTRSRATRTASRACASRIARARTSCAGARFMAERMAEWLRGGRRAADLARADADGRGAPLLRRHAHGPRPGELGRRRPRLRPRGPEPRDPRRLDVPDDRRPQPDADGAGARLAHGDPLASPRPRGR